MKYFKAEFAFRWGVALTIPYLIFLTWIAWIKWEEIPYLAVNEIGDSLAGAFGPIAFLWLILGYLQQQQAIKIQAQELKNSVEQQKELVTDNKKIIDFQISRYYDEKQPKIDLQISGATVNKANDSASFDILLSNHGYPASDISLQCDSSIGRPIFYEFNSLVNYRPVGARLEVNKNITPIILSIYFHDGLGNSKHIYYQIVATYNDELGQVEQITWSSIPHPHAIHE